jgi:Conjugal transfer protein TraD
MTDQRKADTRHKIQLGGLIIKAGLGHVDAMALLGLLVTHGDAARDPGQQQHLRDVGRAFASEVRDSDDGT